MPETKTKKIGFGLLQREDFALQDGDLAIIAVRSCEEYFPFVISLLKNIAYKQRVCTSFFSAKIPSAEVFMHLVAQKASVTFSEVQKQF